MKHCILVKWKESVTDKTAEIPAIRTIFEKTLSLPGIQNVELLENVIDRPNRYDLMIVLSMDRDALPAYDESAPHKAWKKGYGDYIESKAIFDYEA